MEKWFLKSYDYLRNHRSLCGCILFLCLAIALSLASTLTYKEDITDFLPVDNHYKQSMEIYRNINAGDKIFVFIAAQSEEKDNADSLVSATDRFVARLHANDTRQALANVTCEIDFEQYIGSVDSLYCNIPYFLSDEDYKRLDTLNAATIDRQMHDNSSLLMLPTGNMLAENISRDPLNIFTPVVERIISTTPGIAYELYDAHIFTKNHGSAIAIITTPYGSSETSDNAYVVDVIEKTIAESPTDISITYIGNATIAVSNAKRIKTDSLWTILLAITAIAAILIFFFHNVRNIMLIVLSVAFGWVAALAFIALTGDEVSVIVIGIASIIIGIAVNYPLHYLAHLNHTPDPREALRVLVRPLLIGNITTVAAFCTLIPLEATALKDLGVFSAMMLMGTIAFVLLFLPHLAATPKKTITDGHSCRTTLRMPRTVKNTMVIIIAILTIVFAYYGSQLSFDTNMQNINYITPTQRELFATLQSNTTDDTQLYVVSEASTWNDALTEAESICRFAATLPDSCIAAHKSLTFFACSETVQKEKISRWNNFISRKHKLICDTLRQAMHRQGYTEDAFSEFYSIVNKEYGIKPFSFFSSILPSQTASLSYSDSATHLAINIITTPNDKLNEVRERMQTAFNEATVFDIASLNSTIATTLADNFNYIGCACALIVFAFLWLSFRRFAIACIAFLPMAVSWIWILGIMQLMGIQFNIVNIILATFIFGQGDDYAIFMTEGLVYERKHGKTILKSYRTSILLSAIIMFIGIGVLIFAKHPALHSLAQVTLIGMGVVIIMTFILPPLAFEWCEKWKPGLVR